MSEMAKTGLFLGVALLALVTAFVVGPGIDTFDTQELVGERLNQFDIDAPKRLKIVKFDADSASAREFEVAEDGGLWTIPSKQGYPADAARQMAEAATSMMDREILRVAATTANDHDELGVVNPSSSNLDAKAAGVGTRVLMTDLNNAVLTDMIIGKSVPDAEGQYYVRNANQDIVFVVAMDPSKLSARFEDWIEDDLLKLSPFDIRKVDIKDYSAEMMLTLQGFQVNWDRRSEMELRYDSGESKWFAAAIRKFDPDARQYVSYELTDDEELNEDVLQELRNALDDLLIVDVERKPAGLSADLKAGEDFVKDNSAASSLMTRGFAPVAIGEEKDANILSSEGEVVVTLRDGVEYVLRFGNLQMEGDETADGDEASLASDGINRYLFVMARFNESMIERPELDELPELPSREEPPADTEEAEETTTEVAEESDTEESSTEGEAAEDEVAEEEATEDDAAEDETPTEQEEAVSDGADAESDEEVVAETDAATTSEEGDELAAIIAARQEIEQENQRRLDEYQDKIEEGKQRVKELNERFGDWYYVISNDVYQKINLSLDKIVQQVDTADDATDEETSDEEVPEFEAAETES